MRTFLANAFAVVRLAAIHEFHLSRRNTYAPGSPYLSLPQGFANQRNWNRGPVPLFHAELFRRYACFEHSNFFKVNVRDRPRHSVKSIKGPPRRRTQDEQYPPRGGPQAWNRDPTTSFLNAATLIYAIGAGITAAAGTRLALQ